MNCRSPLILCALLLVVPIFTRAQVPELSWSMEVVSQGHGFTEGAALAPDGSIFFSDMDHDKILRFDPVSGKTTVWQEESGKTNGLYIVEGTLYGCEAAGRSVVQYELAEGPGSRKVLASTYHGDSLGCPNDLTLIGNHLYFSEFWIEGFQQGSGAKREIFSNRVYGLSLRNLELDSLDFDFETPNGVASSPDRRYLFVGDYDSNKLYRAEVKNDQVGPLELLSDLNNMDLKGPDGMAIALDGRIFLALYGSDKLLVLAPDGSALGILPTGPLTSNCIFAADGKTLYITADQKLIKVIVPKI